MGPLFGFQVNRLKLGWLLPSSSQSHVLRVCSVLLQLRTTQRIPGSWLLNPQLASCRQFIELQACEMIYELVLSISMAPAHGE